MIFTDEELNSEEWKDILGYDYLYQISNLGRFRRVSTAKNNTTSRIKTGSKDTHGYLRTTLVKNGKNIGKKLHRLVAEYFLEGFVKDLTVNHIDFNKANNRLSNLEVMTATENIMDYILKIRKLNSSSSHIGVNYHKQTKKWVARITEESIRIPLGSYSTEKEAIEAIEKYKQGSLIPIFGKGVRNLGYSKFTEEQKEEAVKLSYEIGVPKTALILGMGTTTITTLRKIWKNK